MRLSTIVILRTSNHENERRVFIEPLSLLIAATTFAGSAVARKCADKTVEEAFEQIRNFIKQKTDGGSDSGDELSEGLREINAQEVPELLEQARRIYGRESALRRADLVESALRGARLLWVDDKPGNNSYEISMLNTLGVEAITAWSTSEAMDKLGADHFDLVISDMERDGDSGQGVTLLNRMRDTGHSQEILFYIGVVNPNRSKPGSAFCIVDRPGDLLHNIMDVLERRRL